MTKTIVITGASSGIGKATAEYFAEKGWQVAATMRTPENATELAQNPNIKLFKLDVTDSRPIQAAYEAIRAEYGTIDALLNNAGYALFGPLELSTEEQIRQAYDTLLLGVTLVTRAFIPALRDNGGGNILTVSSVGGVVSLPLTPTYHATKFAVEGLMEGLSYELYPFNINCKIIEPGGIQTDFWNRSLAITEGVADSPYGENADRYLAQMTAPVSENRATPEMVAEVIYEAVTDGKRKWRYPVVAEDFLNYRKSMTDEEWIDTMMKNYTGE